MAERATLTVAGYELDAGLLYDPDTHLWIALRDGGRARVGFDPLGRETSGDVVALSFVDVGGTVRRGEPFGDLEAAKFVGPLLSPLTGVIATHNPDVLTQPGLVNDDPYAHWLVELEADPRHAGELDRLVGGEEALRRWFAAEVERFRTMGMVAE